MSNVNNVTITHHINAFTIARRSLSFVTSVTLEVQPKKNWKIIKIENMDLDFNARILKI